VTCGKPNHNPHRSAAVSATESFQPTLATTQGASVLTIQSHDIFHGCWRDAVLCFESVPI
jgi:hypothetical protein